MTEQHWPTLEEIEAQDKGRINEAQVAEHRERMRAAQRAHRLAEIRKTHGLTQTDVAKAMHVSQRRVSAVERGDLTRTELGTVASYVEALGGRVQIVADFGDEHLVIGLPRRVTNVGLSGVEGRGLSAPRLPAPRPLVPAAMRAGA
jgi:DNA-binding XRE family transcriptional regulator